jgi:hypothetical protein
MASPGNLLEPPPAENRREGEAIPDEVHVLGDVHARGQVDLNGGPTDQLNRGLGFRSEERPELGETLLRSRRFSDLALEFSRVHARCSASGGVG